MAIITGVRFQTSGKTYYFDPGELTIRDKDHVIVETARGIEYGMAVFGRREIDDSKIKQPLKEVMRLATREDDEKYAENLIRSEEAYKICKEKIREHELDMKLVASEYTFDRGKLLFYFTADGRIDFRELVKDLASVFKTRIELRQVGVRDETKLIGGIGICGRPLCCHGYLNDFAPVSIKMAKEQNLSLNQTKISGTCGRLMCCLKNEQETYEYLNKDLPKKGAEVVTPEGLAGSVQSVNILRQTVNVVVDLENDEKDLRTYHISELDIGFGKGNKKSENVKSHDNPGNSREDKSSRDKSHLTNEDSNISKVDEEPEESFKDNGSRKGTDAKEGRKPRRRRGKNRNSENIAENSSASVSIEAAAILIDEDNNLEAVEVFEGEFQEEKPKKHKKRHHRPKKKKIDGQITAGDSGEGNNA